MLLADANFDVLYRTVAVRDESGRERAFFFDFEVFDFRCGWTVELASRANRCPVVVRFDRLAFGKEETATWARERGISLLPLGLRVEATISACIDAATKSPFLPWRLCSQPRTREAASDALGSMLEGLPAGTLLAVLSLPRSGSKSLADHLSLWGTPDHEVEHSHGLDPQSRESVASALVHRGRPHTPHTLRRAEVRFLRFRDMQAKFLRATGQVYFLVERNPLARLFSSISLRLSRKAAGSGAEILDDSKAVRRAVERDLMMVKNWYDTEYGRLGVRPEDIALDSSGLQILRLDDGGLVVIMRTERMPDILRAAGVFSKYVGRNSAQERGYTSLRSAVDAGELVSQDQLDDLKRHPWIRRIHPEFAEP